MTERVKFPEFELEGPRCRRPRCSGVLVSHADRQSKEFFRRCSECGAESDRESASRVIQRFLRLWASIRV